MLAFTAWHWFSVPPLVRGPNGEFYARVQAKFPIGMAESDLVQELRHQGFPPRIEDHDWFGLSASGEPTRIRAGDPGLKYSTFKSNIFPCETRWMVFWHADRDGKVRDIRGGYVGSCGPWPFVVPANR